MNGCKDQQIGSLLHAYELGILSESENERFEEHLLGCADCRENVAGFESEVKALKEVIASERDESTIMKTSRPRVFSSVIWPMASAVLLVLLALSLFWNSFDSGRSQTREVQVIGLLQTRSGSANEFKLLPDRDLILCYSEANVTPNSVHHLVVSTSDGKQVYDIEKFQNYDAAGVGWLLIPNKGLSPGKYTLSVFDPDSENDAPLSRFEFELLPTDNQPR